MLTTAPWGKHYCSVNSHRWGNWGTGRWSSLPAHPPMKELILEPKQCRLTDQDPRHCTPLPGGGNYHWCLSKKPSDLVGLFTSFKPKDGNIVLATPKIFYWVIICPQQNVSTCYFVVCFWWCWGLNPGPHTHLDKHPSTKLYPQLKIHPF
jgi:hypothetical protein